MAELRLVDVSVTKESGVIQGDSFNTVLLISKDPTSSNRKFLVTDGLRFESVLTSPSVRLLKDPGLGNNEIEADVNSGLLVIRYNGVSVTNQRLINDTNVQGAAGFTVEAEDARSLNATLDSIGTGGFITTPAGLVITAKKAGLSQIEVEKDTAQTNNVEFGLASEKLTISFKADTVTLTDIITAFSTGNTAFSSPQSATAIRALVNIGIVEGTVGTTPIAAFPETAVDAIDGEELTAIDQRLLIRDASAIQDIYASTTNTYQAVEDIIANNGRVRIIDASGLSSQDDFNTKLVGANNGTWFGIVGIGLSNAEVGWVVDWVGTQDRIFITSSVGTSVPITLQDKQNVGVILVKSNALRNQYPEAPFLGDVLRRTIGSYAFTAFSGTTGVTVSPFESNEIDSIQAERNAFIYTAIGSKQVFYGKMSNGELLDELIARYWIKSETRVRLTRLLTDSPVLKLDASGTDNVRTTLRELLEYAGSLNIIRRIGETTESYDSSTWRYRLRVPTAESLRRDNESDFQLGILSGVTILYEYNTSIEEIRVQITVKD